MVDECFQNFISMISLSDDCLTGYLSVLRSNFTLPFLKSISLPNNSWQTPVIFISSFEKCSVTSMVLKAYSVFPELMNIYFQKWSSPISPYQE